jgi:hypothetical protein
MTQPSGLREGIFMRGDLGITVYDALTHERLKRIQIRNKITFLAADILVELLAQRATDPATAYDAMFSMRMGSSNATAQRSDTNLGAFVIGKQLADVNKVTGLPGELQFLATLESADANGSTMQEAGLFTRGSAGSPTPSDAPGTTPGTPRMFARQIYPAIPKTSSITIEFDWRIAFTA